MRYLGIALLAVSSIASANPVGSTDDADGAASYTGPVIDLHAHVFFDEEVARSVDPDRLATPDGFSADLSDPRLAKVAAVVIAPRGVEETRAGNNQLREFVDRSDGFLLAVGSVHPDDGEQALNELERIAELGFSMLKLHPITQEFSLEADSVREVVCKSGDLGLPVLFDFSGALRSSEIGDYITLAITCPQTQLVLAHAGMAKFHEAAVLGLLARYPWYRRNIWVEISYTAGMYAGSPYHEQFVWVLRRVGMDRVLFASDYPLSTSSEAIADVERLGLTDAEMHRVFYANASELLGLAEKRP